MLSLARIDLQPLVHGPAIPVLFFVAATMIVCVVSVIAIQWRRVRIGEADATIKMRMIDKGYSPEEIVSVLAAGPTRRHHPRQAHVSAKSFLR